MITKLLIISQYSSSTGFGPSSTSCYRFIRALLDFANNDLHIELLTQETDLSDGSIKIHCVTNHFLPSKYGKAIEARLIKKYSSNPELNTWAYKATLYTKKLFKRHQYDFVLAWSNPISSLLPALVKPANTKLIWRMGDPYPSSYYPKYLQNEQWVSYKRQNSEKEEKWVSLKSSKIDVIVSPSERQNEWYRKISSISKPKYEVLSHIGSQISAPVVSSSTPFDSKLVNLVYLGRLSHNRDPKPLLKALEIINSEHIKARFYLFGSYDKRWQPALEDAESKGYLQFMGNVNYESSLKVMRQSDALVIIEANFEQGVFTPSKLADYAMAGKAVIALSPENSVVHNHMGGNHPGFCNYSTAKIVSALELLIDIKFNNNQSKAMLIKPEGFDEKKIISSFHKNVLNINAGDFH